MLIYQLKVAILLSEDLILKDTNFFLSKNINRAFLEDEYLKDIHNPKNNRFKPYVYSNIFPFDTKSKIFYKDREYNFTLRSFDREFIKAASFALKLAKLDFKVNSIDIKSFNINFLERVSTVTPIILTLPKNEDDRRTQYWTLENSGDIEFLKKSLKNNLEKKYKQFFGEDIKASDDFIMLITLKNQKPIFYRSKHKVPFVANSFEIVFGSDENSQKLAQLAFAVGLGEKNSYGFGMIRSVR